MLEVFHLTKKFGKVTANYDISFFLPDGSITILLGPNLTVSEHLEFIAMAYKLKDYKEYAKELLTRFELIDKKTKFGDELSKGMQQKLSICCALLPRPQVLLFDVIDSVDTLWDETLIMKAGQVIAHVRKDELKQTSQTLEDIFFEETEDPMPPETKQMVLQILNLAIAGFIFLQSFTTFTLLIRIEPIFFSA